MEGSHDGARLKKKSEPSLRDERAAREKRGKSPCECTSIARIQDMAPTKATQKNNAAKVCLLKEGSKITNEDLTGQVSAFHKKSQMDAAHLARARKVGGLNRREINM